MDVCCEHLVTKYEENLFLDDENTKEKVCIDCKKNGTKWTSGSLNGSGNIHHNSAMNGIVDSGFIHHNNFDPRQPNHIDSLEDAPLLINDFYGEHNAEYHCHDDVSRRDDSRAWKKILSALVLCFIFMVAEVVGGYLAGSLAIMTDAAHLFSDFVGFLISLLAIWISRKSATKYMTFGYHRAEVLGALLSVLTVWLLAIVFSILAVNRIITKEFDIEANTMIIVASLGLAINIGMGAVLHGVCHTHSHGLPSHGHSHNSNDNINVRAAAAHVLGDLLQSVGVLISAIIIKYCPNSEIADPICTLIFSIIVIFTTASVAKDSIWFLLEGSPVDSSDLAVKLKGLSNVKHIHSLHIWSLSPGKDAVAVHLAVDQFCDRDTIIKNASSILKSQISFISCTIQVETYNSELISSCNTCQTVEC